MERDEKDRDDQGGRVINRLETKLIYELQEGEEWAVFNGYIIIVHPDKTPRIIGPDGVIKDLTYP